MPLALTIDDNREESGGGGEVERANGPDADEMNASRGSGAQRTARATGFHL
jgi:hypothetical protein